MSDDDLTAAIRAVLNATPFHVEGHRKVLARLADAGTPPSPQRVLRLIGDLKPCAAGKIRS